MEKETSENEPVFVHSGFRTSSTWLWLKLRNLSGIRAYYEPFNPFLSNITRGQIQSFGSTSWKSGHPELESYFAEYEAILSDTGGVPGFASEMANELFVPKAGIGGDLTPGEIDYLSILINDAREQGKVSVLCAVRSLARAPSIRKEFGGKHILLHRNIFHQWCSFAEQSASGNTYFLDNVRNTIETNLHDEFFYQIWHLMASGSDNAKSAEFFSGFLLFQVYSNAIAFDACDLRLDATEITRQQERFKATEKELSGVIGQAVNLSDASARIGLTFLDDDDFWKAKVIVENYLPHLVTLKFSEACSQFIRRSVDEAFSEFEAYVFYARGLGEHLESFTEKSQTEFDKVAAALSEERSLRKSVEDHLASVAAEREAVNARLIATNDALETVGTALQKAQSHIGYLSDRTLLQSIFFKPSGRPAKAIERLFFHNNGRPRGLFRNWIADEDGKGRGGFRFWLESDQYRALRNRVKNK